MPNTSLPKTRHTRDDATRIILATARRLAEELRPGRSPDAPALETRLDRDLGLDSLARVELIARIEDALDTSLSEQLIVTAETLGDVLKAVLGGAPAPARVAPTRVRGPALGRAAPAPSDIGSLAAVLDWHVQSHPERPHVCLITQSGEEQMLSYAELQRGAAAIAAGLRERGVEPGQAVAIMLPTSHEYFYSFYGVLLVGAVPVPIYPPARLTQIEDHLRRHAGILGNARATILITVAEARPVARLLHSLVPGLRAMVTVAQLTQRAADAAGPSPLRVPVAAHDIALLQYTSGSTGSPKGVVLTHANLLANIRAMGQAVRANPADVFVSWLPLYHDMGLIGAWLGSLYYAIPLYVMSPLSFLTRPERWLWAIHQHRGTLSAAPNFAFELCLRKIPESALTGLDLSSLRLLFNGAEPVSPTTIRAFGARFARYGLRPEAIAPVYGLAECSVGLAFPPLGRRPVIDRVRRERLMRDGLAEPAEPGETALEFVASGQPLPGHQIRIVDATGHEVGEREQGRLQFQGSSATSGYFRNPEETGRLLRDGWLDSGDLAYMVGGDVYITGRRKDIIIRAGRNIYPHEIEEAIGNIPGMRKGCIAAFGSPDPASGTERIIVVAETHATDTATHAHLRAEINAVTADLVGIPPDDVVLAPPHTVLKTSSGKIRRAASRELYEHGRLAEPRRAVWWQFLRLSLAGALPSVRETLRTAGNLAYAVYAWSLFWVCAPIVWATVALLPRPRWCQTVIRAAARVLIRLSGTPLRVFGWDNWPARPCIVVANHASYLDGIVLAAVLPIDYAFVAKRELLDRFVARIFLQHIGAEFVERFDRQRGIADARRQAELARAGRTLVFFPEGTFGRMPGLLPFRMGAFVTAAEAGLPVVPIAIRGTRSILRSDQWLPRRGAVNVSIGRPLAPATAAGADGWSKAITLRAAARREILHYCGEPDLADYSPSP